MVSMATIYSMSLKMETMLHILSTLYPTLKGKAVPKHIYGGAGGIGGIAPTHSRPRHYMGMSGQRHAMTSL
jgi:hypothetical protein